MACPASLPRDFVFFVPRRITRLPGGVTGGVCHSSGRAVRDIFLCPGRRAGVALLAGLPGSLFLFAGLAVPFDF